MSRRRIQSYPLDLLFEKTQPVFENEYGEKFEILKLSDEVGVITGDDLPGEIYLVNGYSPHFYFNQNERSWLSYWFNLNPEFVQLKEKVCPVCWLESEKFEGHHVINAWQGGSDDLQNIANICPDCHALVTRGSLKNIYSIDNLLFQYQLYYFGLDFFLCQEFGNKRYKDRHIKDCCPKLWKVIEDIKQFDNEFLQRLILTMRIDAKRKYFYYRSVFKEIIPWDYEKALLK
jgi:hypothetical protein